MGCSSSSPGPGDDSQSQTSPSKQPQKAPVTSPVKDAVVIAPSPPSPPRSHSSVNVIVAVPDGKTTSISVGLDEKIGSVCQRLASLLSYKPNDVMLIRRQSMPHPPPAIISTETTVDQVFSEAFLKENYERSNPVFELIYQENDSKNGHKSEKETHASPLPLSKLVVIASSAFDNNVPAKYARRNDAIEVYKNVMGQLSATSAADTAHRLDLLRSAEEVSISLVHLSKVECGDQPDIYQNDVLNMFHTVILKSQAALDAGCFEEASDTLHSAINLIMRQQTGDCLNPTQLLSIRCKISQELVFLSLKHPMSPGVSDARAYISEYESFVYKKASLSIDQFKCEGDITDKTEFVERAEQVLGSCHRITLEYKCQLVVMLLDIGRSTEGCRIFNQLLKTLSTEQNYSIILNESRSRSLMAIIPSFQIAIDKIKSVDMDLFLSSTSILKSYLSDAET